MAGALLAAVSFAGVLSVDDSVVLAEESQADVAEELRAEHAPPDRHAEMGRAAETITAYDRNPDGTLAARTLNSNGTAGSADLDRWTYSYDGLNRVTTRQRAGAGAVGTVNDTFHYDQAGRIDTFNTQPIVYDPNNNRVSIGGGAVTTYRADNSIRAADGNIYSYAAFGGVTDDGCNTNTYDGFDRLVTTAIPLGRACNGVVGTGGATTYDYDGLDRQIRITTPAIAGLGLFNETKEIRYSGLSNDVYTEESTLPNESARYTTTSAGQALAVTNDTPLLGSYHMLSSDGQGSTVTATSEGMLGGVVCAVDPDPWGSPRRAGGAILPNNPCRTDLQASPNNRWYQGARRDDTTGNYQFGNRTYTPDTGTWLQPDNTRGPGAPSNLAIGTDPLVANRYSYVNGDPINLSDPSGHWLAFDAFYRGIQAAASARPTVKQDQDLLTSDDGTIYRLAIDTANQGDISKADGNFSRDDIEAAAAGGDKLEDVITQILADTDYAGDEQVIQALTAETQRIARNLLTEENSWEEIDTDRPNGLLAKAHTVLDIAGFVPGVGAIADATNAALYALEGDWTNAALSLGGVVFEGATALRGAINSVEAVSDVTRATNNIRDIGRAADNLDTARDATRAVDNATPRLPDTPDACRVNSFTPETEVLMADGSTRPISLIAVGDMVLATDPETGEQGPREVTDLILGDGTKDLVDITIDGHTITATNGHPFWVDEQGRWVDADDLHPGDVLLRADGDTITVDAVSERTEVRRVHNLTVDSIHTYHVAAGNAALLVHNCGNAGAPRAVTGVADDLGMACRRNSFVPATLVLMADGTTKLIADVEVGDMVVAADPETGERGPRRVLDTIVGDGIKELVDVEIDGNVITATDRHPFWVDDEGRWVDAEDLDVGDVLLLANGDNVTVDRVGTRTEARRVHNLTVEGIHTYYVVAGEDPVLVHNCVQDVIDETVAGRGNITSQHVLSADDALTAGQQWVGPGYRELGTSGSGVFRSADDLRQFRMDPSSLTGSHAPGVPHVHFERFMPGARRPFVNNHVPFL